MVLGEHLHATVSQGKEEEIKHRFFPGPAKQFDVREPLITFSFLGNEPPQFFRAGQQNPFVNLPYVHENKFEGEIRALLETAGRPNWDGEGADPVKPSAVEAALEISEFLSGIAPSEISADPRGNIRFDWLLKNGTIASATVGDSGEVAVSGLLPDRSGYRGYHWDKDALPKELFMSFFYWLTSMQGR